MLHRMCRWRRIAFIFYSMKGCQYGFIFAWKVILGNESSERFMCISHRVMKRKIINMASFDPRTFECKAKGVSEWNECKWRDWGEGIHTDRQYYSFDWNWWQSSSKTEKRVSDLIELMDGPRRGERTAGVDSNLKTCSVDWDNKLSSRAYLWDYAALVTAGWWLGYCPGIKRNLRQRQAKIIISIESTNKNGEDSCGALSSWLHKIN